MWISVKKETLDMFLLNLKMMLSFTIFMFLQEVMKPDVSKNLKFEHKISFLNEMKNIFQKIKKLRKF